MCVVQLRKIAVLNRGRHLEYEECNPSKKQKPGWLQVQSQEKTNRMCVVQLRKIAVLVCGRHLEYEACDPSKTPI